VPTASDSESINAAVFIAVPPTAAAVFRICSGRVYEPLTGYGDAP
jgi:hypothetical protein